MEMGEDEVQAIQEWRIPQSLRDVKSILRFANFYPGMIFGFSKTCHVLMESTNGDKRN
jgi:hypothetical protein